MASFPTISIIYDRYHKASSEVSSTLEIRITYNRKQKYISTGIKLYPKEWGKKGVIHRLDAEQLNQQLQQSVLDIRQILMDMQKEGKIDIFEVPSRLKKLKGNTIELIDFMVQRSKIRKYGKAKDTQKRYERFIRLFTQYGKIKTFDDITESNVITYDKYLASTGLKPYSIWNNYHRFLNSFIIDAIDAGLLTKNPYKWINIYKGKETGINKYLTLKEFRKIQKAKLPSHSLERIRDIFVFQTYTCLSYSDLKNFDTEAITTVKGMKVYTGCREKTSKDFTIPLLPPALKILNKYEGKLPVISNVKYNQYLKVVAQAAGIDKPVSTHWARHTGATLLLNAGIPMQIVSKICGHSSTKITEQVYAKLLDETVVDAVQKLL